MHWRRAVLFVVLIMAAGGLPSTLHAQYGLLGSSNMIIVMSPTHPTPGQTVHLTLQSPLVDLSQSVIAWSVNGRTLTEGPGATDIAVVAGKLGSETNIRVIAETEQGTLTATASLTPAEVDLLYDANSYVPPFYAGRALPSPASQLRLQAIARIVRPGGGPVAASDLIYTWKRNGALLPKLSGKGRATAILPAPTLFGTDTITVEAMTVDGTVAGGTTLRIPSTEPLLVFYEDSPLFGIRYRNAFRPSDAFAGGELTIAAVPYFALAAGTTDPRLQYVWRVNNKTVSQDGERPDEITVSTDGGGAVATIDVNITHETDLTMESTGALRLTFSRGSGGAAGSSKTSDPNPFRGQ